MLIHVLFIINAAYIHAILFYLRTNHPNILGLKKKLTRKCILPHCRNFVKLLHIQYKQGRIQSQISQHSEASLVTSFARGNKR